MAEGRIRVLVQCLFFIQSCIDLILNVMISRHSEINCKLVLEYTFGVLFCLANLRVRLFCIRVYILYGYMAISEQTRLDCFYLAGLDWRRNSSSGCCCCLLTWLRDDDRARRPAPKCEQAVQNLSFCPQEDFSGSKGPKRNGIFWGGLHGERSWKWKI